MSKITESNVELYLFYLLFTKNRLNWAIWNKVGLGSLVISCISLRLKLKMQILR